MTDPPTCHIPSGPQLAFVMSKHHNEAYPTAFGGPKSLNEVPMFHFDDQELYQTDAAERFLAGPLLNGDVMDPPEPFTPYGSADSSAPVGPTMGTGPSPVAKLHPSASFNWENTDPTPSPPSLTASPSPRVQSRQRKDASICPRRRQRDQAQHQQSYQSPDVQGLTTRISELSLRSTFQGQDYVDQQAHPHHQRHDDNDDSRRQARSASPHYDYEQEAEMMRSQHHTSRETDDLYPLPAAQQSYDDALLSDTQLQHQGNFITDSSRLRYSSNYSPASGNDHDYCVIEKDGEAFNGDEASLVTAKKLGEQVVVAVLANGKVVYMAGQATVQYFQSPSMVKARRDLAKAAVDGSVAVLSGAGSAIMTHTPVGRVCDSVSTNVNEFRAAPGRYALQGLGIMKRDPASSIEGPESTEALDEYEVVYPELQGQPPNNPVIAQEDEEEDLIDIGVMFKEPS